ncbi:MAG TPA: hypothetical protein VM537_03540 [Anaerolineae bacterium]|nr:hypothetical protein [Anaerolineae bacterium]
MTLARVKIGPVVYSIVEVPNLHDGGDGLDGQVEYTAAEIRLREGLSPQRRAVVLWHELIHAILENAGQDPGHGVIDAVAYGVYGLLSENPELAKYAGGFGQDRFGRL